MKKFFSKSENWIYLVCVLAVFHFVFFHEKTKKRIEEMRNSGATDASGGVDSIEKDVAMIDPPSNLIDKINESTILNDYSEPRTINTGYSFLDDDEYKPASDEYKPLQFIQLSGDTQMVEARDPSVISLNVTEV